MKKKAAAPTTRKVPAKAAARVKVAVKVKAKRDGLAPLVAEVRSLIQSARRGAASVVNTLQVMTNFEIGRRIVEYEQEGEQRAAYGAGLVKELSASLTQEFGRGFSERSLEYMRRFYLEWRSRAGAIAQTPSGKLPFTLSWSHYVLLLTIKDADERLALSRDKGGVKRLAEKGQIITKPEDVLKEPYVLEFLGLDEKAGYSESDLESAIISQLERFLLELGKGFLFESRQRRFTFDEDHYFVDLVFYNRLLRCYVIIDLKLDKLTHQDLGQMQMYVNYYDRQVKLPDENATLGLLLCKDKKDAVVKLTLPKDANILAREYQLYLPSKELLKAKLIEWAREEAAKA